jgi:hypothetical protein
MFRGSSEALHPVPAALDWPPYDRETLERTAPVLLAPGTVIYSLASEQQIDPMGLEVWSRGAIAQRDQFWQRVLRDRCGLREAMQVANGGKAEADAICKAEGRGTRDERRRPSSIIPSSLVITPGATR